MEKVVFLNPRLFCNYKWILTSSSLSSVSSSILWIAPSNLTSLIWYSLSPIVRVCWKTITNILSKPARVMKSLISKYKIKSSFERRIYLILTSLYIRSSGAEGSSDVMVVICFASFNNCPSMLTISPSIRTILCFSVYSGYSVVSLDVGGRAIFRLFYGTSRNAYYSVSETSLRKKLVL